ncbi:amino acid permease [Candidatus Uabimicrobium amorphum]|uniref:Na-K-Cl cotransporter n=1 Tax=Uabimicrobium amorphum TaxID=2596890 RepID=A0A5S9IUN5_UABAM|nr:amino acid permease [Candidatus Uabimicrobium amorphum]BBM87850.1 Na-K-Cl cotransporter [Candidatus Uabimicrobium amorphum]
MSKNKQETQKFQKQTKRETQKLQRQNRTTSMVKMKKIEDLGANKFGTFGGVFTPCTLTILGVIMFLRYGQVVGQSGLINAIIILLIAKVITTLTSFSLSAIATNTRVKGGGAYYLISRSLGVELGGAIGVFFFLAQAISVAMYVIGFTEAFIDIVPPETRESFGIWFDVGVASAVNFFVFVCVFIGAGWAIKVQYVILGVLLLSLVSFFAGAFGSMSFTNFYQNLQPSYSDGESFFTMFALFFPAVTGIMAGANMSGDLKDPGRSIPKGTLSSIIFTGFIYLIMALVLAAACTPDRLINDSLIVKNISWSTTLVVCGIFAATLSSALGSMMGAPRILQAFAKDNIFSSLRIFAHGSGVNNEPRRAVILTFFISQLCILLGDLNAIAPIITMFFMITYGMLNLSTFYESITKNPSYRPRFRYSHWSTELIGALGCIGVMFLISPLWAIISILAMAALRWYIERKEIEARWGDVQGGVAFERARKNLLIMEDERHHPKNWRPIIIALSGGVWSRVHLAVYGHWLTAGHGVLSLGQIIVGNMDDLLERRRNQEKILKKFIRDNELSAFPAVVVGSDLTESIKSLVQCHGLGGFHCNSVLLGWSSDPEKRKTFASLLRALRGLKKSLIMVRTDVNKFNRWESPTGTVDIWWRGQKNGHLMLLLAHLLLKNNEWRTHRIRLLRIISSESGLDEATNHMEGLIHMSRIEATAQVVVAQDVTAAMRMTSARAAIVFMGFAPPEDGNEEQFFENTKRLSDHFSTTIFVSSAGGMELDA